MAAFIELRDVAKSFGPLKVVEGLNLDVAKGEFLSLLGPSGSGKTTILMMLAGFEDATSGEIVLDGQRLNDLPPHRRGMGVVFQNYALFPHMSVAENVAFPLQMRGVAKAEVQRRVTEALARVHLEHLAERRPSQLSGGQQQRVALTRALVFEPKVILMDEPLGALDKQLREAMQLEIRDLHRRLGLTIVFVTHDQSEALTISDRIAIFDKGKIAQIGTASEVYDRPRNRFVSQFIGETNLLEGRIDGAADGQTVQIVVEGGRRIVAAAPTVPTGADIVVSVRPERICLTPAPGFDNILDAEVEDVVYQGDHLRFHLACGSLRLVARAERSAESWPVGTRLPIAFRAEDCSVFSA
ncbi:polyamine ABC transporter ATP-binding protein [Aurantimonas aggregata]|uniref:Spermidine/putrescine import ATP-binding protein PotA n=1 Tax=Aurantimonas aggregata TaxID=2047720 RepID=A0A6L9MLA5_9HYPH|nr:ABC transporter ATP-binding protein [Aurantimonas aggregata]NDV88505.1 polyamine ABC transporter ATP-binding protein [Aurantimonas aggregata]